MSNKKTIQYFDNIANKLQRYSSLDKILGENIVEKNIQLAEDEKGARVNGRIDAMRRGEEFDESDTPPDELKTKEEDMIDELINREINDIFGE